MGQIKMFINRAVENINQCQIWVKTQDLRHLYILLLRMVFGGVGKWRHK